MICFPRIGTSCQRAAWLISAAATMLASACGASTSTGAATPTTVASATAAKPAASTPASVQTTTSPQPSAVAKPGATPGAVTVAPSPVASPAVAAASPVPAASPLAVNFQVGNPSSAVTLQESGSTLVLPYLQKLADPFHAAYSNITLAPSGGGSGKGISDAAAGTVQLGGSDAYLSDQQAQQNGNLLNIPIAISSQAVNYNLPGIADLKLNGDVLARMYEGHITNWNDAAIGALNPGVSLPNQPIIPVRRVDASGDTFIFSSLLTVTNGEWKNGPAYGTTVTWPAVQSEVTANGNPGMVQVCQQNPGCVAYIGISVEQTALSQSLGEALLQNQDGQFLHPTQQTVAAAVSAGAVSTPDDLRQALIYVAGEQSYPIVNYEYLMVQSKQPDANTALALRTFFAWAIDPTKGSTPDNLNSVQFVALPESVLPKAIAAIGKIS